MMRKWMTLLASATIGALLLTSDEAAAGELARGYVLFELIESDTDITVERLRSESLGNCKQLVVGTLAVQREVILDLVCEPSERNKYWSQAVIDLAGVDGVKRATVLAVKAGSE